MNAIIVVDMVFDFVYGKLGFEGAKKIIPNIKALLEKARKKKYEIIYVKDTHFKNDIELKVWGEHAMDGEKGSEIIDELKPKKNETIIKKHTYSSFFDTELDGILKLKKVDKLFVTGVATNICILHTVADAFFRGYKISVVKDCTASFESFDFALETMKKLYNAKIVDSKEV
ncbi:MAG: isochorismatase family cysteine hydrolase [Candidatus Thermoplasmatota archaeon]